MYYQLGYFSAKELPHDACRRQVDKGKFEHVRTQTALKT